MPTDLPFTLLPFGAHNGFVGTLTARTLMLAELSALLETLGDQTATRARIGELIVEENVCAKPSRATRQKTLRHLRELYGLSDEVRLWRTLRFLWRQSLPERPLLALLIAFSREPVLRLTWNWIADLAPGQTVWPAEFDAFIEAHVPGRYGAKTRIALGKNVACAWAQSGHLSQSSPKRRARAQAGPASVALALYLGHLEGLAPEECFHGRWTSLLDAPQHRLDEWAFEAHKRGWLDYRRIERVVHLDYGRLNGLI